MIFIKPKFWDKTNISIFSILLFPITLIFKFVSTFKRALTKTHQSSIPVICVGNIYLGGTGKTPLCIEIFSILKNLNMNPVFIRKKYDSFQDEVNLQKQKGPVYENKIRIEAINEAVKKKANVAILDDGFQDFSINKNFSIICFNEKQWLGNGFIIPSGPLRENLFALNRADCIVINGKKNTDIENKIRTINKDIKIFYSKYNAKNINEFKNKKVIAFAGIGNPENFFTLLKDNKIDIVDEIKFPDHYQYSKKDLEKLIANKRKKNSILLTTEKDYLRIGQDYKVNIEYLKIETQIENKNKFSDEIKKNI